MIGQTIVMREDLASVWKWPMCKMPGVRRVPHDANGIAMLPVSTAKGMRCASAWDVYRLDDSREEASRRHFGSLPRPDLAGAVQTPRGLLTTKRFGSYQPLAAAFAAIGVSA